MSVPNQKTVIIHQSKETPFIKIGKEEWKVAFNKLRPAAFALFMYLAGNQEGYRLELSEVAYENATGKSRSSYYRAKKELMECGYLYQDPLGHLNFATSPKRDTKEKAYFGESSSSSLRQSSSRIDTAQYQNGNKEVSEVNREKDNRKNIKEEIKKENASSEDFSYLYGEVTDWGCFDGKYLDEEISAFWEQSPYWKKRLIAEFTRFSEKEAEFIVDNILIKDSPTFIPDKGLRIMSTQPSYRIERRSSDGTKVIYTEKGVEYEK